MTAVLVGAACFLAGLLLATALNVWAYNQAIRIIADEVGQLKALVLAALQKRRVR